MLKQLLPILLFSSISLGLTACQTTVEHPPSKSAPKPVHTTVKNSASAKKDLRNYKMNPSHKSLGLTEVQNTFRGKTISASQKLAGTKFIMDSYIYFALNGEMHVFDTSTDILRDQKSKFQRGAPFEYVKKVRWVDSVERALPYLCLDIPGPIVLYDKVNKACFNVLKKGSTVYMPLAYKEAARFVISDGPDRLIQAALKYSKETNNEATLVAIQSSFPSYNGQVSAVLTPVQANLERQSQARLQREQKAKAEKQAKAAEQRAYEKRRAAQEAKCKRETGSACKGTGGGLLGSMIRGSIDILEDAANAPISNIPSSNTSSSSSSSSSTSDTSTNSGPSLKNIRNNGSIAGNPSYVIDCSWGSKTIIRKDGKWTNDTGGSYSDRTWGLGLNDFSAKLCARQI